MSSTVPEVTRPGHDEPLPLVNHRPRAFLGSCGVDSVIDIHVLVVTGDGAILAIESGHHTDDAAARLLAVLRGE